MEEVWAVYLCLILMVIVLVLMKQNPHVEEARKDRESKPVPPSSSFYPSNAGKQLEHTQEELDKYLERLNRVLFGTEGKERDGHHGQKSQQHRKDDVVSETEEHSEKKARHSQHLSGYTKVQGNPTPPGSTEDTVEEMEQEAEETADTDLHERRQHQSGSRRHHQGSRPEAFKPETDAA